ncbi:hypothetical protein ABPG74_000447 [Tetrahymena malaccensis]
MDLKSITEQFLEKGNTVIFKLENEILFIQIQNTSSDEIKIPFHQIEYQQIAQKLAQIYKQINQNPFTDIIALVNQMNCFNVNNEINNNLACSYQEEEDLESDEEDFNSEEEDYTSQEQEDYTSEEQEEQENSFQAEEESNMEFENNSDAINVLVQNKQNEDEDDEYDEIHQILLLIQKDSIDIIKRQQQILEKQLFNNQRFLNKSQKKQKQQFESLFEQEYYSRFLKNKEMNKHFKKILKQNINQNKILTKVNLFQEQLQKLNELIINMISKDSNIEIQINFNLIQKCQLQNGLDIQNLQLVNIQRIYHTQKQKYRNVYLTNFYSNLIELLEQKNYILNVENLELYIEDQNIITHDQDQSIDHCMYCYNVVSNCGDYGLYQMTFDLKNIKAQNIQIELQQNESVFHDIILYNQMKQVTFTGDYGFGVNFIFKSDSFINQVNWNVKKFSLPFTIWVFEKFFIGKIGHLCFQNLTDQCYYDSLVSPSIFMSPISYSFNKYHRKYEQKDEAVKDLQVKLNERFILQMQIIVLYELANQYFNLSPFKIVQDLFF